MNGLNARQVIAMHVRWKNILQFAVAMEEDLTEEQHRQIRQAGLCAIGRWLETPAAREYCLHKEYQEMRLQHLNFHREMEKIAALISSGQYKEAGLRIDDPHGRYLCVSQALAVSIMVLDRVAPLRVAPVA